MLLLMAIACRSPMYPPVPADGDPRKAYTAFLQRVVTEDGYVDYNAVEANRTPLDRMVAWIASEESYKGKKARHRHAYWLNAYNTLVLFQVMERDRPSSVLEPDGWLPFDGSAFFMETTFDVGGNRYSLAEIEHERIRHMELDFRDHAAMNCASMSCPPLRNELYKTDQLQAQLREQMERWVMDDNRGVRIEDGVGVFNPIFDWFHRDFVFTSAGMSICEIAATYSEGDKKAQLEALVEAGCPHRFFDYDWSLNDISR